MIIRVLSVVLGALVSSFPLYSQNILYAVQDGTWTSATTDPLTDIWSADPGALIGEPGLRPTAIDDVFTNGRTITIGSGAVCKNLAVSHDQAGKVVFGSALMVTGTLGGWDDDNGQPAAPIVNVFSGNPIIRYTGANLDGMNPFWVLSSREVIGFWNKNSPLGQGLFQLTGNATIDGGDPLSGGVDGELQFTSINISGGNQYELSTGSNLTGVRISGSGTPVVVGQNARFVCFVPVYGIGGATSKFSGTASINGYLYTTSFFNATTVNIGGNGRIETSFSGGDQTEGWWYQNSRPSINPSIGSTVAYTANGDQNVFLRDYSNLILSGSGTKQLAGIAGSFTLSRSLTISSSVTFSSALASRVNIGGDLTCEGAWQPTNTVNFNGISPAVTQQTVSGSGALAFGNLEVSNSGISLTLNLSFLTISNGITVGSGSSLNLGAGTVTISGGNVSNSGTITSGAGTLSVTSAGTTNLTGIGATSLNNLNVSSGTLVFEAPVSLKNLTTGSAGSVSFNASPTFTGNITNNGNLEISTIADLTFTGGSSQSIDGNGFTVYNMIVNKSAGTLSNNTTISLLRNLAMTGGTFDADGGGGLGNFVLVSNTNGDATIGQMTSSTITGQVTFQRYFNNTVKSWRNMGFPVKSVSISDLSSSIAIGKYSISYYDETAPGDVNQGWSYLTDGNLFDKLGYSVYMYSQSPVTISVRGELLQNVPASAYNFGVTYYDDTTQPASEDGWNLVANPFACPIDWNDASWTKTRVNGVAAIWDASTLAYRNSGTAGWDGILAPGQAVWVQTNGNSPSLLCTENAKRPNITDANFYRVAESSPQKFGKGASAGRLSIMLEDTVNFDETIVHFAESANAEFDASFDAHKLKNQIFNLSSLTAAGSDLAINVLPQVSCRETIKLKVSNIKAGSYHLKFDGLDSFSERTTVSLKDNFTGKEVSVIQGSIYKFYVTSDPMTFGAGRFELTFDFNDTDAAVPVIEKNGRKLTTDADANIQWLFNGSVIPAATENTYVAVQPGVYQVEAIIDGCLLKSEVIDVDQNSSASKFYPNPASFELNVDVYGLLESEGSVGNIFLFSSKGEVLVEDTFNKGDDIKVLDIKGLKPGVYILKAFSGNTLLVNERIVIKG